MKTKDKKLIYVQWTLTPRYSDMKIKEIILKRVQDIWSYL